jgi:hypothetical protein
VDPRKKKRKKKNNKEKREKKMKKKNNETKATFMDFALGLLDFSLDKDGLDFLGLS